MCGHKVYCAAGDYRERCIKRVVSVSGLTDSQLADIDAAIAAGHYRSRSDFLCRATVAALRKVKAGRAL